MPKNAINVAIGVKRTWPIALHMSAYDPKRKTISSCVIVPADVPKIAETGPKLTKNQQTMYSILRDAGPGGLTADQWNERLREAGIGTKRKADIYDARAGLKAKNLVREFNGRWRVPYED